LDAGRERGGAEREVEAKRWAERERERERDNIFSNKSPTTLQY
jgi:hypothetical protein